LLASFSSIPISAHHEAFNKNENGQQGLKTSELLEKIQPNGPGKDPGN
jgi:hypothetical protein